IGDADALVLASAHEGLPHAALEALAAGTPLVAVRSDGVADVVEPGVNGLLVDDSADVVRDLSAAVRELATDRALVASLARGAAETGTRWRIEPCVDQLEQLLESVVDARPRAVFVGKSRASVPPTEGDERKYAINQRYV